MTRFSKLRQKEVVNVLDGARLGYVCDMLVDLSSGKVCAIVVPGPSRLSFIFRGERDNVIPWCNIRKIGEDVILVEIDSCGVPNYQSEH